MLKVAVEMACLASALKPHLDCVIPPHAGTTYHGYSAVVPLNSMRLAAHRARGYDAAGELYPLFLIVYRVVMVYS